MLRLRSLASLAVGLTLFPGMPTVGTPVSVPVSAGVRPSAPVLTILDVAPVPRSRWVLALPEAPKFDQRVFSLPEGARSVALDGIPPGLAFVCLGGDNAATVCRRLALEEDRAVQLAGPVAGMRVTGGVAIGTKPAAGAEISVLLHPLPIRKPFLFPLGRREGEGAPSFMTQVRSDEHGRFVIPLLAPGDYRLDVRFPGGRSERGEPFSVPDLDQAKPAKGVNHDDSKGPPVFDLGEMVVPEGLTLQVAVTDRLGKPLPHAHVSARQGNLPFGSISFSAKADGTGTASLAGLEPQAVLVTCSAPGFHALQKTFDSLPGLAPCALTRFSGVEGRIVGEEEEPTAGVTVTVRLTELSTVTGRDGRFSFDGMKAGRYDLVMAAPGYRILEKHVQLAPEERLSLAPLPMEGAQAFRGRIVDGGSGEPVSGAAVSVTDPPGAGATASDEEGIFALQTDSEGSLTLAITSEHHPAAIFEVPPQQRSGENADLQLFKLYPGGRIHVTVWDEQADAPCFGCSISLFQPGADRRLGLMMSTDQLGASLSPLLAPGPYQVYLERVQSLGSVVRVSGGDNIRGATVEPGKTAEVNFGEKRSTLEIAFVPAPPPDWSLRAQGSSRSEAYSQRRDGTFQIRKPGGEALRLILQQLGGNFQVLATTLPTGFEKAYLSLPLPATAITATVVRNDEPLAHVRVDLVSLETNANFAWGSTGGDGSFSASFLPAGSYRLLVDGRPVQTITLEEGAPLDLGLVAIDPDARRPMAP